jgi:hypothetical protein
MPSCGIGVASGVRMSVRKKGLHSGREDFDISRIDLHARALTLLRLDAKRLASYLGNEGGGRNQEMRRLTMRFGPFGWWGVGLPARKYVGSLSVFGDRD